MSNGLGETAWVDRHLGLTWERVRGAVPNEDWLPQVVEEGGRAKAFVEYGCGHYGCVMPTYDNNVVMKLTSDQSEAFFVAAALSMDDPNAWNGLTEYYAIYRLKASFHRKRPLYALWREAAHDVGIFALEDFYRGDDYKERSFRQLTRYLEQFKESAAKVRDTLKRSSDPYALVAEAEAKYADWAYNQVSHDPVDNEWLFKGSRGAQRIAAHLRACALIAELMEHTYMASNIGECLTHFLENGLLLADVHANNIGLVTREDNHEPIIVITDPGHAVPLIERWDEVVIEEI